MSDQPTWTPTEGKALMMRTCASDMTSYHGTFTWPESGPVEAPDWNPQAECGQGLHGLLWGAGSASLLDWDADAKWLVVEVDTADIVGLGDKVKVPAGVVIYAGERHIAASLISAHAPAGTRVIAGTATAGYGGTATAADRGTATAGDEGTATAGDRGTATAGDEGVIAITWWDSARKRYRRAIGEVGIGGIQAGVAYHVVDGHLVPVESIPDADLGPLLNATRIHTDDDGRHFDDQGREYTAVEVDGEVTYRLIGGGQ